jgi:hypothetical protein
MIQWRVFFAGAVVAVDQALMRGLAARKSNTSVSVTTPRKRELASVTGSRYVPTEAKKSSAPVMDISGSRLG